MLNGSSDKLRDLLPRGVRSRFIFVVQMTGSTYRQGNDLSVNFPRRAERKLISPETQTQNFNLKFRMTSYVGKFRGVLRRYWKE